MDQDTFNLGIRKFLRTVGVGSQREIEQAVAGALATGKIAGSEPLAATMTLKVDALALERTHSGGYGASVVSRGSSTGPPTVK